MTVLHISTIIPHLIIIDKCPETTTYWATTPTYPTTRTINKNKPKNQKLFPTANPIKSSSPTNISIPTNLQSSLLPNYSEAETSSLLPLRPPLRKPTTLLHLLFLPPLCAPTRPSFAAVTVAQTSLNLLVSNVNVKTVSTLKTYLNITTK